MKPETASGWGAIAERTLFALDFFLLFTASARRKCTSLRERYEIRWPIHRFITLNGWEREIISQAAFPRLRRIRQLAWTDYVYPGAMHTRFEHSLGVMQTATLLYEA